MFITLVVILIFFLFSQVNQSTGKTTSLLILGILEGIRGSNSKMAMRSGDGTKTGTTMYVGITKILLKVRIVQSIVNIIL